MNFIKRLWNKWKYRNKSYGDISGITLPPGEYDLHINGARAIALRVEDNEIIIKDFYRSSKKP